MMAVYRPKYKDPKTGKLVFSRVYWFEFTYAGNRIRESSKQTKKTLAQVTEDNRRRELVRSYAGLPATETPKDRIRTVKAALASYQKTYPVNHRQKSVDVVSERSPHLLRHLGSLLMPDLTEERMQTYMAGRKAEGAGNRTVNIELGVLARAVGSKWSILWPKLKHLEELHDVGRAVTAGEEQRLVDTAMRNRSRMIGPIIRIALMTGMRRDEIRLLTWRQINFDAREITVGRAKTEAGKGRVIPFGPALAAVLSTYVSWYASKLGPIEPDWYVFPLSNRGRPADPTRPVTTFKTAWGSVCDTASVECRFHDLRHTVCTKMAEAGVPEATMKAIMGHMSRTMLERYSHIRRAAKVEAWQQLKRDPHFRSRYYKKSPK
jgi:integrase